jgi:imidazolonepropionase-like amidohydrolase
MIMSEATCIGIVFALTIGEVNKKKRKKYWMKEWLKNVLNLKSSEGTRANCTIRLQKFYANGIFNVHGIVGYGYSFYTESHHCDERRNSCKAKTPQLCVFLHQDKALRI